MSARALRRAFRPGAAALVGAALLAVPPALDRGAGPTAGGHSLAPHVTPSAPAGAAPAASPTDQVDVSRTADAQAEVAVAADPAHPEVLLAGSNSFAPSARVYGSVDGGATWTSDPLPVPKGTCGYGDPALAIAAGGRQFYAYLTGPCASSPRPDVSLALATRPGPDAQWTPARLHVPGAMAVNDKEAIAIDVSPSSPHFGRLYLAWSRFYRPSNSFEVVVAHSDDSGATWSTAVRVTGVGGVPQTYASLAIGADGTLYIAWLTLDQHVRLDHSTDGGDHFGRDLTVDSAPFAAGWCSFAGASIPAQAQRCVTATPLVTWDPVHGRVYVTYSGSGQTGREKNVYVSAFDAKSLQPLVARRQVNPPDGAYPSDQFLPASAVDASTGQLWVCWYDTSGDRTRKRARYTCASSGDGAGTWSPLQRAASVYSNETSSRATSFQYGDYAGIAVAGGVAHPIWTDSRDLAALGEEIYTTALTSP